MVWKILEWDEKLQTNTNYAATYICCWPSADKQCKQAIELGTIMWIHVDMLRLNFCFDFVCLGFIMITLEYFYSIGDLPITGKVLHISTYSRNWMSIEQWAFLNVPNLLWHRASVYIVISEGTWPSQLLQSVWSGVFTISLISLTT